MSDEKNPFVGLPSAQPAAVTRTAGAPPQISEFSVPPLPPTPPEIPPLILIIDDEPDLLKSSELIYRSTKLKDFAKLSTFDLSVGNVVSLIEALKSKAISGEGYHAIYVDLNLAGNPGGGISLIQRLRKEVPSLQYTPFAIITAYPDDDRQRRAVDERILRFIVKTDPNPTGAAIVGQFLHRLIVETPELISQAEDRLWFDLNEDIALRCARSVEHVGEVFRYVADFLRRHFAANAIYARRLEADGQTLTWMAGIDGLQVNLDKLPLENVPFLRDFINGDEPFLIVERLTSEHLAAMPSSGAHGCRALVARMSFGRETIGVVTVYRSSNERRFRRADGNFLHQLAQQLGSVHYRERQVATFRQRQTELVRFIHGLENMQEEGAILEALAQILHSQICSTASDQGRTTVRRIAPGTIRLERAAAAKGFDLASDPPVLTLKMRGTSTMADAIFTGEPRLRKNMPLEIPGQYSPQESPFVSGLVVPIMSEGVCLGAVNLESTEIGVFTEEDRDFAGILCDTVAGTLIRLRARHFNFGMLELLSRISIDTTQEPADIVEFAVRLLFNFTGYAELLYLVPPPKQATEGSPWTVTHAFGVDGLPLASDVRETWSTHLFTVWKDTYLQSCISAERPVSYTQNQSEIEQDNGIRKGNGGATVSQAVVLIKDEKCGTPLGVMTLLFVQRHALNGYQLEFLEQFGILLGDWFRRQTQIGRILGMLTVRDQEARLGQVFGQFRHSLSGQIAAIRQYTKGLTVDPQVIESAREKILTIADRIGEEIDRNRSLVKRPEAEFVEIAKIWKHVREDLAGIAADHKGSVSTGSILVERIFTVPDILTAILFNLADNALRYGGEGVDVKLDVVQVNMTVHLDVIDTGRGIAETVKDRLFQAGTTINRSSTGMGLYLSQLRAKDLDGELQLVSSGPTGTCFRVTLPVVP